MRFSKVLGKCDPKLIAEAEDRLSAVFTELAMGYRTRAFGSKLGGDILLHQLISPLKHICDARAIEFDTEIKKLEEKFITDKVSLEEQAALKQFLRRKVGNKLLRTAATNGLEYLWNPEFVVKQSRIGLRLVVGHEGWHSIYMHPSRRGSRIPSLWNQVVDFKVNFTLMDDLRSRGIYQPDEMFRQELGDFITLQEYASFLRDPFNPPIKLAGWNPINVLKQMANPGYKEIDKEDQKSFYFADMDLKDDMKKPENIYSYLLAQMPKCKTCGKIGAWKKSEEYKKLEKELKDKNDSEEER